MRPMKESRAAQPSLATILSSLQLAYQPPAFRRDRVGRGNHALAARMADVEEASMSEEDFMKEMEAEKQAERERLMKEDPELLKKMDRINRGMKSASGAELAPWMKVDAEAIVKAERARAEREMLKKTNANMEVSGEAIGSITAKQLDGTKDVKIGWKIIDGNLLGYEIQRRTPYDQSFVTLSTYANDKRLRQDYCTTLNEGAADYIDEEVGNGGVDYRVLTIDQVGKRQLVGQTTIQVEEGGGLGNIVALVFLLVLLGVGVFFGVSLDSQSYDR